MNGDGLQKKQEAELRRKAEKIACEASHPASEPFDPGLQVAIRTAYSDYSWEKMISRLGNSDRLLILKKTFDAIEFFQIAHALTTKGSLQQSAGRNAESPTATVRSRTEELEIEMAIRRRSEEAIRITLRELAEARDAALESSRQKGQFLATEQLTRIFAHGFTTKEDGHGFGLRSAMLAAHEMGGSLTAHSDGPGHGAVFTLELPCDTDTSHS